MTNGEFYKERLNEITDGGYGIAIVNNIPEVCYQQGCDRCGRYKFLDDSCSDLKLIEWYNSEYTSEPKLTKKQRAFCECIGSGWLVRYINGEIVMYKMKPIKKKDGTYYRTKDDLIIPVKLTENFFPDFTFIKIKDDPISIEEMLTWEVEE